MLWAPEHRSLDDSRVFIRRARAQWLLREELQVAICERHAGRLLGGTGLHRIEWEGRRFEIGYWLRTSAEGHGYMQEGVKLLTVLAFETLQAQRVQIRMDPRNARSQSVAARLGYVFEGTLRRVSLDGDGLPPPSPHLRPHPGPLPAPELATHAATPGAGRRCRQ